MPRIPELKIEDASPPIEAAMRAQIEQFGYVFNATKVLGHCPEVAQAATVMGQALDREGNIDPSLRFLLYTRVALLNDCPF